MKSPAPTRGDRLRAMLADLKMPGALEAVDSILSEVDGGAISAAEAIAQLLGAQIGVRNNRRLKAALRSSRLPAVKTLDQFDFALPRILTEDHKMLIRGKRASRRHRQRRTAPFVCRGMPYVIGCTFGERP